MGEIEVVNLLLLALKCLYFGVCHDIFDSFLPSFNKIGQFIYIFLNLWVSYKQNMEPFVNVKQPISSHPTSHLIQSYFINRQITLSQQQLGEFLALLAKTPTQNFHRYVGYITNDLGKHIKDQAIPNTQSCNSQNLVWQWMLALACEHNSASNVSVILKNWDKTPLLYDSHEYNPLLGALKNQKEEDSYEIIRLLISKHPQLIQRWPTTREPLLTEALKTKSIRVFKLLLQNCIDPNLCSRSTGNTVLHEVMPLIPKNYETMNNIAILLLNSGANPYLKNINKQTVFDIAAKINFNLARLVELTQNMLREQSKKCESEISLTKDQNSDQVLSDTSSEQQILQINMEEQISQIWMEYHSEITVAWRDIQYLYSQLSRMASYRNLSISFIGSYPTGLWSSHSDIDIALTNTSQQPIDIQKTMSWFYSNLNKNCQNYHLKESFLNIKSSFPNIKLTMDDDHHCRKIDITIFQKNNVADKYVKYIEQCIYTYPQISPIFCTFHQLLKSFDLHLPSKTGLKTYAIFLMILKFVQNTQASTMTQLFIKFIEYYANSNYFEEINQNGEYKEFLYIMDRVKANNNAISKKTDINRLHNMFKVIDSAFKLQQNSCIKEEGLDYIFQLGVCLN